MTALKHVDCELLVSVGIRNIGPASQCMCMCMTGESLCAAKADACVNARLGHTIALTFAESKLIAASAYPNAPLISYPASDQRQIRHGCVHVRITAVLNEECNTHEHPGQQAKQWCKPFATAHWLHCNGCCSQRRCCHPTNGSCEEDASTNSQVNKPTKV